MVFGQMLWAGVFGFVRTSGFRDNVIIINSLEPDKHVYISELVSLLDAIPGLAYHID